MQKATCTDLRIRSTADAHKIFMGVRQGLLHLVTRRLDADERLALRSGCIYAWEERGPHTETTGLGIERFTEGRRWSPSRVRDEFLFYYERYSPPQDLNNPGSKSTEVKPPRDWDPLVKQTYSVWVETEKGRRKWHLTAYFTQATIDQLSTVDDIPRIQALVIPDGMFKSTRLAKNRSRSDENKSSDVSKAVTPRSYAAFPLPYQFPTQTQKEPCTMPVFMHEPYQARQSAEPQSPLSYESLHSPTPHENYHQAYPNENGCNPFAYHRPQISLPTAIASFSHPKPNGSARQEEANSYYLPADSPTSWSNDGLDYSHSPPPPPYRLADIGAPSPPLTSSLPTSYGLTENGTLGYTYQAAPMQNNPTSLYSTPYSLNSVYTPPPALNPPNSDDRDGHLLSSPERSNSGPYVQAISPITIPTLQNGPESYARTPAPALAPLNVIRRPIVRRGPQDEINLWMLRGRQANP